MTNSVVQPWLAATCTLKMQTVLLTSFRGCDGAYKNDLGKPYTRLMRCSILKNADATSTFFPSSRDFSGWLGEPMSKFFTDMDHYPIHWFMHLVHAAEIVGYKCPDGVTADFWWQFYQRALHELHVNEEKEAQLDYRLQDNF